MSDVSILIAGANLDEHTAYPWLFLLLILCRKATPDGETSLGPSSSVSCTLFA